MTNIIDFRPKPTQPSFTLNAEYEGEEGWHITIKEFYRKTAPPNEVLLEIAEALIPIAGGLVRTAEAMEPTERGKMVANISLFAGGHVTFQSDAIDSEERRAWFNDALNRVKVNFIGKKKRRKT